MRESDDLPYIVIERRSGGATPFLWGALLGAGLALLLAPRSGAETQEEIRGRARRLREAAEGRVTGARDAVTDRVTRTRDRVQERIHTVRDVIETRTGQVRDAVETGRQAAMDARSQLQRRIADAKSTYGGERDAPGGEVVVTDVATENTGPDLG